MKRLSWLAFVWVAVELSFATGKPARPLYVPPETQDPIKPLRLGDLMAKEHQRFFAYREAENLLEAGKGNANAFDELRKSQADERKAVLGKKVAGVLKVRAVKTVEGKEMADRQVVVVLAYSYKHADDDPDALLIHAYATYRNDPIVGNLKPGQQVLVQGTVAHLPTFYGDVAQAKLIGCTILTTNAHTNTVRSVDFSWDGKTVASAGDDETARLWDPGGGKNTAVLNIGGVCTVKFSPDGKTLAAGSSGDFGVRGLNPEGIKLFDIATGKMIRAFDAGGVRSVAFTPDGKTLASVSSCSKGFALPPVVSFWNVGTGERTSTWTLAQDNSCGINAIALSPDGKTLATAGGFSNPAGRSADLRLWDVASGKNLATLKGHAAYVLSAAFSPDGKMLATGSNDTKVMLWDVPTSKPSATLTGHTAPVYTVAFSPDSKTLASGGDETIRVWDVASGKNTRTLGDQWLQSLAFSANGKTLAAGGGGPVGNVIDVKLWDVASGAHKSLGIEQGAGK